MGRPPRNPIVQIELFSFRSQSADPPGFLTDNNGLFRHAVLIRLPDRGPLGRHIRALYSKRDWEGFLHSSELATPNELERMVLQYLAGRARRAIRRLKAKSSTLVFDEVRRAFTTRSPITVQYAPHLPFNPLGTKGLTDLLHRIQKAESIRFAVFVPDEVHEDEIGRVLTFA